MADANTGALALAGIALRMGMNGRKYDPTKTCKCNERKQSKPMDQTMDDGFVRRLMFRNAYHCERDNGDPHGHGIGSMEMVFVLIGPKGATQFLLNTGWYFRQDMETTLKSTLKFIDSDISSIPAGWDLGYHAKEPQYEDQTPMGPCDHLGVDNCYYDGSGLNAKPHVQPFLEKGPDYLWEVLREEYEYRFGEKKTTEV